ncbi:sulfite reductase subunit alpha [Klebsiella michiganensis]|uniref:Sulfite reductase subunit alpha n=1 Tax=Klebsiella michiganensis TaxID=1134687 RepID=A0A7H4PJ23_9ENTR|nr:sulfite reductase subunit alpha [Klebsiella michiganensis]
MCAILKSTSATPALRYQPGDALGVWYQNDPALVKELVELLWLTGEEPVTVDGKTLPLAEALEWHFRADGQHR